MNSKKEDCRIDHDELKKVLNVGVPIAPAGDDRTDFLPCDQLDHQRHGSDAVRRIRCGAEADLIHHADPVLCDAVCVSIRGTEHRSRKERPRVEGLPHRNRNGLLSWSCDFLHRFLRWKCHLQNLHERSGRYRAERRLPARFRTGMYSDLCAVQQHRILQRPRHQHPGYDPGNHLRLPDPYSAGAVLLTPAEYEPDLRRHVHPDHNRIRHLLFHDLLCTVKEKRADVIESNITELPGKTARSNSRRFPGSFWYCLSGTFLIQYRQKERNPVQKGQNRRKGEEEWINREIINETLVHLFHEIQKLEEEAIITEDFKDLTNNDMHIIEAVGVEGGSLSSIAAKLRHHGRIADNVDEQSGEKRLHRAGAQREGTAGSSTST